MAAPAAAGQSYALLADGTTMTIRPAAPGDYGPVRQLHEAMSPDNLYFRFFSASQVSAEREARRVCRQDAPGLVALLGLLGDEVVGVASYELIADPAAAEIALAVADNMHRHGIATLLLEHLVSVARARGVKALVADVLPDNYAVLRVLSDAGLAVRRRYADGVVELSMPVPRNAALGEASTWLDAVADRDKHADVASLESLLAPRSAVVVGAGRRPGSVGRTILLNIRDAGFAGPLYAVSPHGGDIEGIPCLPSVADLPEAPDLAVLAVPAARVAAAADECGRRGVGSLVVITSGLTSSQESDLLAATRRGSMRLVGPNSFGVAVPGIGLAATFGVPRPSAGHTGLVVQSGAVGAALIEQFSRLGIGLSCVVSVGDKLDVSVTDMLLWWDADDTTELALLYLESFGHPRRFARTARRVTAKVPVLTVHAGRSAPGQRAAASHTAAAVAPLITRQALFEQAGIIATTGFGELVDAAVLMASQPIPAGQVVAIVSNGGGAGVLAADACAEAGLAVATTGQQTRDRLREVLPAGSALDGPIDTTDAVSTAAFREALHLAAAQDGVHALIALVVRRGPADLIPVLTAERWPVPVAAVVLGQPEAIRLLPGPGPAVPAYAYPEAAARALARAARYGSWRSRPAGTVPELAGLRVADAQSIIDSFLARMPGGGWLSAEEGDDLLRCYGLPMVEFRRAADADAAVEAAAGLGGHVVIKADVPGLLHKSVAGAVELDLSGPEEVRAAMRRLQAAFAGRMSGVLVEPMVTGGVETIVGVVAEPVFGPVVVFGLGGVATGVLGDHAARLAPLTDADADDLIHAIRAAPALLGPGPAADVGAVRDTLLRVSRLADDLPQVAELDLNPVIACPDGVVAVDARIRVTSQRLADPFLRQLPSGSHPRRPSADRLLGGAAVQPTGTVAGSKLVHAPGLGWHGIDLSALWPRYEPGREFVAGNDATMAGVAESRHGACAGAGTMVYLHLDAGVGGAVVEAGRAIRGTTGAAGEFGHMPFGDPARRCRCGARGCWNTSLDGRALARLLHERVPADDAGYLRRVLASARAGQPGPLCAIRAVASSIGRGVAGLVNGLDPHLVVLGGFGPELLHIAADEVTAAYHDGLMAFRAVPPPPIVPARLGSDAPLLGAADEAFALLLTDEGLQAWAARQP